MAKPINPNLPQVTVPQTSTAGVGRAAAAPVAAPSTGAGADGAKAKSAAGVNISGEGRGRAEAMAKALDIAKNTPDIREDRVADIKARIAAGSYQIDSGAIADGMLREAIKDHLATER